MAWEWSQIHLIGAFHSWPVHWHSASRSLYGTAIHKCQISEKVHLTWQVECKNPAFHLVLQTFIWHACLDVVVLWVLQPTWMSCCMSNRNHCAMERCNGWRLSTAGYKSHLLDPHIQEGAFKPIYGQTNIWNCQENHLCIQVFHNWWKKPEKNSPTCVNQSWGHYNTSIVKHLQEFD